jgi:hypothetical protein
MGLACRFSKISVFVAAVFSIVLATGCGNNEPTARRVVHVEPHNANAEFINALLAAPQSEPLAFSRELRGEEHCVHNVEGASHRVLSTPLLLAVSTAQEFYDRCEQLFSCSSYGRDVLQRASKSGQRVSLSFVDFSALPGARDVFASEIHGVYPPRSWRIFLRAGRVVSGAGLVDECGTLLHEMVHWLHDLNGQQIGNFEDEYDAHYYENMFQTEYSATYLTTAEQARQGVVRYRMRYVAENQPLTLERLGRVIIEAYNFSVSDGLFYRVISRYSPFPWESENP